MRSIYTLVLGISLAAAGQIGYSYARIAGGSGTDNKLARYSGGVLTDSIITDTGTTLSATATGNITITSQDTALFQGYTTAKLIGGQTTVSTFAVADNPGAGVGGDIFTKENAIAAMNGSDTVQLETFNTLTNANHTGVGNTLNLFNIPVITGDANANLNAVLIGALTGTVGAAGETEYAINVAAGWDASLNIQGTGVQINFANASGGTIDGDISLGTNDVDDITINGPTTLKVQREDFNSLTYGKLMSEAFGGPAVTDTAQNMILMPTSQIGIIGYRYEQAFAGAANLIDNDYLDLDVDDTDNDGIAAWFGESRSNGTLGSEGMWDEDNNESQYCEVSLKITDVSEVDIIWFGYLLNTGGLDVIDAGNWATCNTCALFTLDATDGIFDITTKLNAGATTSDTGATTFADGNEKVLRVTISADTVSFSVDGVAITQTNAVLNWDDGDLAACQIGYVNATGDATPAPGIKVGYIEIGVSQ